MDPRTPYYSVEMPVRDVLMVIVNWLERDPWYYWDRSPDEVMEDILNARSETDTIPFYKAREILYSAKTSKCPGHANRGIGFIENQWKKDAKGILAAGELKAMAAKHDIQMVINGRLYPEGTKVENALFNIVDYDPKEILK